MFHCKLKSCCYQSCPQYSLEELRRASIPNLASLPRRPHVRRRRLFRSLPFYDDEAARRSRCCRASKSTLIISNDAFAARANCPSPPLTPSLSLSPLLSVQLRSVLAFNVWERFQVRLFSAFGELGGSDTFYPTRERASLPPSELRLLHCAAGGHRGSRIIVRRCGGECGTRVLF